MNVLIYGFSGKILGGIETFILNMNEHMSKDCVFDYIIDGDICVYHDRIEKRGGKVFFVPGIRKEPINYIFTFWKLLGEQKRLGTTLFYQQLFSMANLLPAIMAKMRGYKVILHAHNNGLQSKSLAYVLIHKTGKSLAKCFHFVYFTNSQLSSDYMFGKGVKSELIYNAIDTEQFSFDPKVREAIRAEINCGSKTVIGFVGRLARQKNPVFLIKVFAEFLKLCSESELWIVGEGELKEQMEAEIERQSIKDSIKWLGRREDVNNLMMGMDILLQPSLFEGLGIVLVEAQATGLNVVSSKDVIPKEAMASNRIQLVSLGESPKSWAEACKKQVLDTSDELKRIKMDISDNFNISFESKRLEEILNHIA